MTNSNIMEIINATVPAVDHNGCPIEVHNIAIGNGYRIAFCRITPAEVNIKAGSICPYDTMSVVGYGLTVWGITGADRIREQITDYVNRYIYGITPA